MKKQKIIIRILYGDIFSDYGGSIFNKDSMKMDNMYSFPKLLEEVRLGCKDCLNDSTLSVALGQDNYDFLKDSGAKNIVLFDKRTFIHPKNVNHFWHKPYIIKKFLEEYEEVCMLDWDNKIMNNEVDRCNEENIWDLIHSKKEGVFNGGIQVALVRNVCRMQTYWRYRDKNWKKLKMDEDYCIKSIAGCSLTYSSLPFFIDGWLSNFEEVHEHTAWLSDESVFSFYYDKLYPASSIQKMFEDFGCYVVAHVNSFFKEKLSNAIFKHR